MDLRASATSALLREMAARIEQVVVGQSDTVELAVASWAAGCHLLLEDHPGSGKTTLARALAQVLGLSSSRIQGTPDLLPSDLTGVEVFHPSNTSWDFRPGPLFREIVLVDEVDRISPRTQSALLEAMAERQVSADGITRSLPDTHWVVATRLPELDAGGYALLPAQLDRFGVSLRPRPLERGDRARLLAGYGGHRALAGVGPPPERQRVLDARHHLALVTVSEAAIEFALDLIEAASPLGRLSFRPAQDLLALGRALALLHERDHVRPVDLRRGVVPVLAHRLPVERDTLATTLARVTPPW